MERNLFSDIKLMFIPCQDNKYRPEFLDGRILLCIVVILLILKVIAIPIFVYLPKSVFFADITSNSLIKLANEERISLGLNTLSENSKLNKAAYLKAQDMIEKDYFSHQSTEGLSPWYWFEKVDYDYKFAGENLAIGFLDSDEVHQAWLDSNLHRDNLLNPNYQDMGIAVIRGEFQGSQTLIVVQLLGSPKTIITALPDYTAKIETIVSKTQEPEKEVIADAENNLSIVETNVEDKPEIVSDSENSLEFTQEISFLKQKIDQNNIKDKFRFNLMQFFDSDYNDFIKDFIYALLILIAGALLLNIFIRPDIQHKDLIFKTIIFIVLLLFSAYIDKELIIQLIPHNLTIY